MTDESGKLSSAREAGIDDGLAEGSVSSSLADRVSKKRRVVDALFASKGVQISVGLPGTELAAFSEPREYYVLALRHSESSTSINLPGSSSR